MYNTPRGGAQSRRRKRTRVSCFKMGAALNFTIVPSPSCCSDVNNVNGFIEEDPSLEGLSLWKLMKKTEGSIFNNVAQARHEMYKFVSNSRSGQTRGDVSAGFQPSVLGHHDCYN